LGWGPFSSAGIVKKGVHLIREGRSIPRSRECKEGSLQASCLGTKILRKGGACDEKTGTVRDKRSSHTRQASTILAKGQQKSRTKSVGTGGRDRVVEGSANLAGP